MASAKRSTPPAGATAETKEEDSTRVILLLQKVLSNQDEDRHTTSHMFDTLKSRMGHHEATTSMLIQRLDHYEKETGDTTARIDARLSEVHGWSVSVET